jgi:catechol 2,3-dioxygenase-like lactoylglutathione lyase family enzyme
MLGKETLVAFLTTATPDAARAFYEGVLGLELVVDDPHLMVFKSGPARVSLQKSDRANPPRGTALGWDVADLRGTIKTLVARGVAFERYGLEQDELGIWSPAPGHGVAWFKDPDGNTLSLAGPI